MLITHGDIVDVITPINILFRGGGKFWPLMEIKHDDYDDGDDDDDEEEDDDDDDDHDDCKCDQRPGWGEHV